MQFAEKKIFRRKQKKGIVNLHAIMTNVFLFVGETWKLQKEAKIKQKRGFRRKKTFV